MNGRKQNNPRCILVLGMHRSGTSCLAGCLQERGLFLGEVFEKNPFNLIGNRENKRVMQLNISVLEASVGNWDRPPEKIIWDESQAQERDQIIASFANSGQQTWGFKAPRSFLTLPFWEVGLEQISFVGTFRNPTAVAKSLNSRDGIPFEQGLSHLESLQPKTGVDMGQKAFPSGLLRQ